MERIFSDDERIRRAEEIYLRRNNKNIDLKKIKNYKDNNSSVKLKIALNLILMINIGIVVFVVQNKNYIFTEQFLNDSYSYLNNIKDKCMNKLSNFLILNNEDNKNNTEEIIIDEENNVVSNELNENTNVVENSEENISSSLNEMEEDIANIKNCYSFIKPVENGTISSLFGNRESNKINVNGYHTGLDIASDKGNAIKCAMQGIVEEVSSKGDYGNHFKIRCNNITTLYAHCENIYVEEGQIIAQGQEIATVGESGNTTGPHLHFEIRVDSRYVDPLKILNY